MAAESGDVTLSDIQGTTLNKQLAPLANTTSLPYFISTAIWSLIGCRFFLYYILIFWSYQNAYYVQGAILLVVSNALEELSPLLKCLGRTDSGVTAFGWVVAENHDGKEMQSEGQYWS